MSSEDTKATRVLLVEDDTGYAQTVIQILSDMNLTHAGSYKEALEMVKEIDSFDCALVDLNLVDDRDGRGRSIISAIKRRRADFPVAALTAFEPGAGNTFESTLREIGADDIVRKSADPQHGNILRATVERLLGGELQPLVSRQIAKTLERVTEAAREWKRRQDRSEQWRIIVRRHFSSDAVPYLADPLIRVCQGATSELSALENELLTSFGRRGSVESINRARNRLESSVRQHEGDWAEVVSVDNNLPWISHLAKWLIRLDLTVLIVLAGVLLSIAGEILVRWKLDHTQIKFAEIAFSAGALVAGLTIALLAGVGQKVHSRVQEAWSGSRDAFTVEELVVAKFAKRLVGIGLLVALGLGLSVYAFILRM